ncbi:right-handed parallel beta-helix repeat-containing protein [candidate division WOR-3 bacterium]|nr:right-handed parallel beta-helix repeat-containing protein [candidate division WOR-3 bacterium]
MRKGIVLIGLLLLFGFAGTAAAAMAWTVDNSGGMNGVDITNKNLNEFTFSDRVVRFSAMPHAPIYIDSNDDFVIGENGVVSGDGTESNPYIIEGWNISASAANGIEIKNTDIYFIVRNCKIHNNSEGGICFHIVEYSTVSNNCISDNLYGIFLDSCNDNLFDSNVITGSVNGDGISMDSSMSNTLVNNTIESNRYTGIGLWSSSNNIVYHNNLIDNSPNGYDDVAANSWDNGAEGNYWSDYTGIDEDGDGIGDTAYNIAGGAGAKDNYPFMRENGWITEVENQPPVPSFSYSPENPVVNQTMTFDASNSTDIDGTIISYEWDFGDGNITNTADEIITHSYSLADDYIVNLTVTDDGGLTNSTSKTVTVNPVATAVFDTGSGTYPSIAGTHTGTITPNQDITVQKMHTYPCIGTGGHTEHVTFYYSNGTKLAEGHWTGYTEDWYNITFDSAFTLYAGETYNYTIRTGSYPQIIHEQNHTTLDGSYINCTEFTDANGRKYNDWIPAIRLWA